MTSRRVRILTFVLVVALLLVPVAALALDWSPPTQIGPWYRDWPWYPAAAAGPNGTLSVVWTIYPVGSLLFNHFNGETWDGASQAALYPPWIRIADVAVGADGISHLVWMTVFPECGPEGIMYARLDQIPARRMECTGLRSIWRPTIAVASSGEIFIAVRDNVDVKFVHRGDTGWSTPEVLGQSSCNPYLSMDSSGVLYITYCSIEEGNVLYRQWIDGVWAPPTEFEYVFSTAFGRVEMFHHENGTSDLIALGDPIHHWHFDGSGWLAPTAVASETSTGTGDAAMGPDGLLAVIWPTGTPSEVMVRVWDGEAWLPAENVSNTETASTSPTIGITSQRKVIAVWSENQGAEWGLFARVSQLEVNKPPTVEAGGPYSVYEGGSVHLEASGTDPEGGPLSYAWDLDGDGVFETPGQSALLDAAMYDGPSDVQVAVKATDSANLDAVAQTVVAVSNVAPSVGSIAVPSDPVQAGFTLSVTAGFADPGVLDTHTAMWDWGDGNSSPGTITEADGVKTAAGSHAYTDAGVYTIRLTLTDDDAGVGVSTSEYAVVYDPSGGFVTGGGWINSPAGAYAEDPSLTGRANFGFVARYIKGAQTPSGVTEFQFRVADLNFHSESYDWLVVAGHKAMYKGTGTINGEGSYRFMLSAIDGDLQGGDKVDRFRMRIWDATTDVLVYDNQLDAPDGADPTTATGGGSIVIHKDK